MEYKFKKKLMTGRHTFFYKDIRHQVLPGGTVVCEKETLGKCLPDYEIIGEVNQEDWTEVKPINDLQGPEVFEAKGTVTFQVKSPVIVAKGNGFYDVINPDNPDKPLNEKGLRKSKAESFLSELINSQQTTPNELEGLDWSQLMDLMEKEGIEIKDEYTCVEDLINAIVEARKK